MIFSTNDKAMAWLFAAGLMFGSCAAMNGDANNPSQSPIMALDLVAATEQAQILLQQGHTLEQVVANLKKISELLEVQQSGDNAQAMADDNKLQLMLCAALLVAAMYGVYLWHRPYQIERETKARVRATEEAVIGFYEEQAQARKERQGLRERMQPANGGHAMPDPGYSSF